MTFSTLRSLLLAGAAIVTLGGFTVGPAYRKPQVTLEPAYQTPAPTAAARTADLDAWWRGFGDPELTRVVERAADQNLDIAQAAARVRQSRAIARAAGAALAPNIAAQGSAAAVQQSLDSPIGEIGRHLPGYERNIDDYALGVGASWELDLFGGQRRARDAAHASALGAADQAVAVRTSVEAEAADAYLQVRAYQGRLAVAQRQAQVQQDLVALVRRRFDQGVVAERELHQAEASLEAVNAAIPPLTAGLEAQLDRLDVLMGAAPGTFRAEVTDGADLAAPPGLAGDVRPGELLRRRPDVLAAEQRLVAANAGIGAAIADYYPKISISGLLGVESLTGGGLFTGDAVEHQVEAGFSWRLFDFGRVDAEVAQARGGEAEALAAYRGTVLRAAQEVETALSALRQDEAQAAALARQVDALERSRAQTQMAYEGGVASLLEVRDLDRESLAASDQLIQARAAANRDSVALFRALGGGWTAPV